MIRRGKPEILSHMTEEILWIAHPKNVTKVLSFYVFEVSTTDSFRAKQDLHHPELQPKKGKPKTFDKLTKGS